MSSERGSTEGNLPDGVADRSQGYTHNPNPSDELAEQQAHFAARQRKYQQERAAALEAIEEVQHVVEDQAKEAQHVPEHQAFVAEQQEHQRTDPPHVTGGQEQADGPTVTRATASGGQATPSAPNTAAPVSSGDVPRLAPMPVVRDDADRLND